MMLLTGSSGFIGSAVYRQLAARNGIRLRLLRRIEPSKLDPDTEVVRGDLTDPVSLAGSCDGVDVLVHAASYVGSDPASCEQVNHAGTAALVDEARRAGVRTIVYVSTASVYGPGPHENIREDAAPPRPQSPVSVSRAAAEVRVRAAGGIVVRPHLVYGAGDRWVVPHLAALLSRLPGWIDGGAARLSMIQVDDLARLVCALAVRPPRESAGAAYHANHPQPVRVRDAGQALQRRFGVKVTAADMTYQQVAQLGAAAGLNPRHLEMIATDHWFASERLWELTGCRPGLPFPEDLARAGNWYPDL
jgi:nucleoside-diphosphate-sugar epimerase